MRKRGTRPNQPQQASPPGERLENGLSCHAARSHIRLWLARTLRQISYRVRRRECPKAPRSCRSGGVGERQESPQLSHSGSDGSPLIRDVHAQDGGTGCTTINAGADSRCFQAMWGNRWFVPGHRPEARRRPCAWPARGRRHRPDLAEERR
jgi:hypothetical protein